MEELVSYLIENKLKIATAESCTGGLLASRLTDIPGVSEVFEMGIVSYSNRIKNEFLGVKSEDLEKYGAVSEAVAKEMSKDAAKKADADIGVGITGIAGPGGGTIKKPVGTVWLSFYFAKTDENPAYLLSLSGSRAEIRNKTCDEAVKRLKNHFNI